MEQVKGLSNINTVVSYVLDDMDAQDKYDQYGEKIAQLAIRGFIDMNIHYSPTNIKVVYLTINNNRRVTIPNDYVDYTKIGINIGGTIWTLTANPNMVLDRASCCNLDIREVVSGGGAVPAGGIGGFYYAPHYWKGNYVGGMWGAGGGWNDAYYRIDVENRQIQFDGFFPQNCQVILEYKSTGINFNTETVIPRQYVEPLVAYIHYKLGSSNKELKNYDKEKLEQDYINQMEKLTMFNTTTTLDEIMDVLYASYTQLPKR
jgi:hypothetical protein